MVRARCLTPEQTAQARDRYEKGDNLRDIAKDAGVSKDGVRKALERIGVKFRKKTQRSSKLLSPEDFVLAYQEASSYAELSAKTGLSLTAIQMRRKKYKDLGVKLKIMPRNTSYENKIDVAALNALIEQNGQSGESNETT